jgi:hypothetical protein
VALQGIDCFTLLIRLTKHFIHVRQGQEEQLFRNLAKKYSLDPSVFGLQPAPAPTVFGAPPPGIAGTPLAFGQPTPLTSPQFGSPAPFGTSTPSSGTFGQTFGSAATAPTPFGGQSFGALAQSPVAGFGSLAAQAPPTPFSGGFGSVAAANTSPFGASPFGAPRR